MATPYSGAVDKDYAALVAQVIPVAGLALGLELRSLTQSVRRRRGEAEFVDLPTEITVGALGLIASPILAAGELAALWVVEGRTSLSPFDVSLGWVLATVFLLPATEFASEILPVYRLRSRFVRSIAGGLLLAVMILAVVILLGTLFDH